MAGILDLIPEVGKIIELFVPDPQKKLEAERLMKELDIRELEARMGVQKAWLSNNSLFVAGAIPTVLWMVSVVIFFNHILAPLLQPLVVIPTLELPQWYASLTGTIVLGLFGKKAWDSSEISWNGQTVKPAKEKAAAEILQPVSELETKAPMPKAVSMPPTQAKQSPTQPNKPVPPAAAVPKPGKTQAEVDARLAELCREKGIEP